MVRKPENVRWIGFTPEQAKMLDFLDHIGNNGWARNSQTEELMPNLLAEFADEGVSLSRVKQAMESIGYDRGSLHELDRWESKRTTGKFGR